MQYLNKKSGNKVGISWGNYNINASGREAKIIGFAIAFFFLCYGIALLIKANK